MLILLKITAIQGPDNYPSDVIMTLRPKSVLIPYRWFHHIHTQYQIATGLDFSNSVVNGTTDVFSAGNDKLFEVAIVDNDGNVAHADDVRTLACGDWHTVIIREDNSVWGTGWNYYGQLGLGNISGRHEFTNTGITAKFVACGTHHTVIIKDDGSVWVTGYNYHGQLGLGDTNNRYEFTNTGIIAKQVACGGWHTVIIKDDDSVWVAGRNGNGQLGLGDTNNRYEFTNTGIIAKLPEGGSYYTKYWVIPNNPLSQPPTSVYPVSKFNINGIRLQPNPTYDPETGLQTYTFQDIRLNEPSNIIKLSVDIPDVTTVTEISMDLLK